MDMYSERVIGLLNDLIEVNNDRIDVYKLVCGELKSPVLKNTFRKLSEESVKIRKELADEVSFLGGSVTESFSTAGPMFRTWMDIRTALKAKDVKGILLSTEYCEASVLEFYEEALKVNYPIPVNVLDFLIGQKQKLKRSRSWITEQLNTIAIEK
jgi:uncharacterized protein (TIGR02284 family)